jgi:16S rRNA (uracil1498-N3)-methyltransferase
MAQIVRDAVELGVWRISPVICEFSVAKPEPGSGPVHWRAEAVAAAKQSGNPFLPAIDPPRPLAAALEDAGAPGFYGALSEPGRAPVPTHPNSGVTPEIIPVFVGPEGGFSAAERAALAAAGHRPVALGSWTLRVETAATAIVGFLLGMGGDDLCCHQRA